MTALIEAEDRQRNRENNSDSGGGRGSDRECDQ
jgi:hypothetical protein